MTKVWVMKVIFTKSATGDLQRLDTGVRGRVFGKLNWLLKNFDSLSHIPLGSQLKGFFKLRVGNWRIVYELDLAKDEIVVHAINRRDRIYKRF